MKTKSLFKQLSPEDRQRIIDLCHRLPYADVRDLIAQPRPYGLHLQTSDSALCRFYCSHHLEARKTVVLQQSAATLEHVRQRSPGSFRTALVGLLESRLFEALTNGTPVAELKAELAALKDLHKAELAALKDLHKGLLAEQKSLGTSRAPSASDQSGQPDQSGPSEPDFILLDDPAPQPAEAAAPEQTAPAAQPAAPASPAESAPVESEFAALDQVIATSDKKAVWEYARRHRCRGAIVRARLAAHRKKLEAPSASADATPQTIPFPPGNPIQTPCNSTYST